MLSINGREVGPIGYGLMGLTWRPQTVSKEQAFAAMRTALKNGANFWNGGEFYGTQSYNSMTLLNEYFKTYPEDADKVVLSIKGAANPATYRIDASPDNIRRSMDNILKQLGPQKKLDVFECARRDPNVSLAATFDILQKEYIETGKLGGIALSEVSAATIHEAVKVAKIVAVEVELSLWSTEALDNGVAAACAQYNIPLIAYSPLSRGILAGAFQSPSDIQNGDFRALFPRFQTDNFNHNVVLADKLGKVAQRIGCTKAQLAINWVRCQSRKSDKLTIIPIPGATTVERINENTVLFELSEEVMLEIENILSISEIKGGRYPDGLPVDT
ncbi:aldo/keto reductase [Xylogone sp. PMI_703]|nr:aldo/keto reductase [Xylogone sp. PMI_703]